MPLLERVPAARIGLIMIHDRQVEDDALRLQWESGRTQRCGDVSGALELFFNSLFNENTRSSVSIWEARRG
jgi:hypothetical protein